MTERRRGRLLTALAIFYLLAAIVDIQKAIEGPTTGTRTTGPTAVVVMGMRQAGPANTIAGLVVGTSLLIYAAGIWRMRPYAMYMAYSYAAYVTLNVILYSIRNPFPGKPGRIAFDITFKVLAIVINWGTVIALARRRNDITE